MWDHIDRNDQINNKLWKQKDRLLFNIIVIVESASAFITLCYHVQFNQYPH